MKTVLTVALLAAAALPAMAEPLNYNVVEFSESASSEVPRDTMTVRLNVQAEGSDRATVNREFVRKFNSLNYKISSNRQFKSELLGRNAYPNYQYKNGKRTQIGWLESADVKVESTDFTALNRLIAEAQNEANVEQTYFSVSKKKREEVVDSVSKAALLRFKDRASTLAKTLGFSGYKIVKLNLGQLGNRSVEYAAPQAGMLRMAKVSEGAGGEAIEAPNPGTESIGITVNGTVQM